MAKSVKETTSDDILTKISSVSDSTNALQREIKSMSKIFADNQKILVSMKTMIDTLSSTLEHVEKQSKQITIIEEDTKKLYAGLDHVNIQSDLVSKLNEQTARLEEEVNRMQKIADPVTLAKQAQDNMNSIQNNSKMIIKVAQRIDQVRDDLKNVTEKTDTISDIGKDIENLKNSIDNISKKTSVKLEQGTNITEGLKADLEHITEKVASIADLNSELDVIKSTIDSISSKASSIDTLGLIIKNLQTQFKAAASEAESTNDRYTKTLGYLTGKIDKIETEINTLSHRADSTAFVGQGLKSVQTDLVNFKEDILDKTNNIEQKISSTTEIIKRQDATNTELYKKTEDMFKNIQSIKNTTDKASEDASKEMMALLRLSEFQSSIRMNAESKYGGFADIEKMARQTVQIINLFDKISIEADKDIHPFPHEVKQWVMSKILDCADKWEIRFDEVYAMLKNILGKKILNESLHIQQVRDIYGIRAVDKIRSDVF